MANSNKMEGLLDYLRVFNELEEESLAPVKAHYNLGAEISKAEEAKKQAAIDEDYENAAKFKKLIVTLKEEAMTVEKLRTEYIEREPILRTHKMLELMNQIDPGFTKTFVESNLQELRMLGNKSSKAKVVNQLLVLQAMTDGEKGLEKVKNGFEESLQVIHEQVRATEHAQKTMAYDLHELTEDELEQFKGNKKVKVFLTGI